MSTLGPHLRKLLDDERNAPLRSDLPEMKARARQRLLEPPSGGGGGGSPPASAKPWVLGGLGAAVGLTIGLTLGAIGGAVVTVQLVQPKAVYVPVSVPVHVPAPVVPAPAPVPVPAAPSPAPDVSAPRPANPVHDPAERVLVDQARVAMLKGDAQEALVTLMGHERRFPGGMLVEEREALVVQALVALGRQADAEAHAQAFRERYPHSVHLPAVDRR